MTLHRDTRTYMIIVIVIIIIACSSELRVLYDGGAAVAEVYVTDQLIFVS